MFLRFLPYPLMTTHKHWLRPTFFFLKQKILSKHIHSSFLVIIFRQTLTPRAVHLFTIIIIGTLCIVFELKSNIK